MFEELSARRSALGGFRTNFDGNAIVADEGDLDIIRHFKYAILSMKGLCRALCDEVVGGGRGMNEKEDVRRQRSHCPRGPRVWRQSEF